MKTRTLIWILAIWMASIAIMMMVSGCKVSREFVSIHDTLRVVKTDTCYKVKTEYSHDTLRIETEKIITVSVTGDTLKVVEWRDRWRDRYVAVHDTLHQSKTDTVYISKDSDHEKVTVKQDWWTVWKWRIIALLALCAVIALGWYTCKGKVRKWLGREN